MPAEQFGRLKALDPEQLTAIQNALALRTPECQVARMIQGQWGLFQNVAETTLVAQLRRYNRAFKFTPGDPNTAVKVKDLAPLYERLNVTSSQIELAVTVRARLMRLIELERVKGLKHNPHIRAEVETYNTLLKDIQKQQFDLGVDTYQGPARASIRAGQQTTTLADGTTIVSQVIEATNDALTILDAADAR